MLQLIKEKGQKEDWETEALAKYNPLKYYTQNINRYIYMSDNQEEFDDIVLSELDDNELKEQMQIYL